jgi:hypothetical protein
MNQQPTLPSDLTAQWRAVETQMQPPAPQWIIEGVIAQCELLPLTGATKDERTYLAADLALTAATGGEWLGLLVQRSRVCFVSKTKPTEHWQRVARYHGVPDDLVVFHRAPSNIDDFMRQHASEYDLIIFDYVPGAGTFDLLSYYASVHKVALITPMPVAADVKGRNYLHIWRDAFQEAHDAAVLELGRGDKASQIDVIFDINDDTFILATEEDGLPY